MDFNELEAKIKNTKPKPDEKNVIIEDAAKNEWIVTYLTKIPDVLLEIICDEILSNVFLPKPRSAFGKGFIWIRVFGEFKARLCWVNP